MWTFSPDKPIPFSRWRASAFTVSLVAIVLSIGAIATRGLNFGVDFSGGALIEIATPGEADLGLIRGTLGGLGLGDVQAQLFGAPDEVLIRVELQEATEGMSADEAQTATTVAVRSALEQAVPGVEVRRTEVVSPTVSSDLVRGGLLAVGGAIVCMLLYIWFRFEWQFGVAAVAALTHDVIITIGMFAVTQLEFNLNIIAAILTIVGYSINDTVVVFDRIRENLRKYKRMALPDLLDGAVTQTLSRTTMTSFTTLLALFALYFLGGEVLRGFSFALIWGIVIGTYSSIFIASPLLIFTGVRRDSGVDVAKANPIVQ